MADTQQRTARKHLRKTGKTVDMKKATARSSGNGIWCNGNITVYFFEDQVRLDHTSFIDGYIEKTHVMIEQKSTSPERYGSYADIRICKGQ